MFCALQEYKGNCSVHSWSMRKIVPCIPGVRGKLFHALLEYEKKLFRTLLEYEEYCSANSWSCLGHCRSTWEIFQHILGGHKRLFHAFRISTKIFPSLQMNRSKKLFPTLSRNSKKLFLTLSRSSKKLLLTHSRNSKKLFTTLSRSS